MAFKGWKVGLFPAEIGHRCEQAQEPTHTAPRTRIAIKGVQTYSLDNVQHKYCKTLHVVCRNLSYGRLDVFRCTSLCAGASRQRKRFVWKLPFEGAVPPRVPISNPRYFQGATKSKVRRSLQSLPAGLISFAPPLDPLRNCESYIGGL